MSDLLNSNGSAPNNKPYYVLAASAGCFLILLMYYLINKKSFVQNKLYSVYVLVIIGIILLTVFIIMYLTAWLLVIYPSPEEEELPKLNHNYSIMALSFLGVGTSDKWDDSVVTIGSEKFLDRELFPHSARTYDNLIRRGLISGNIGSPIPLSDGNDSYPDGGAHLDEIIFDTEVMTPIADQINVISSLSIAILEDLGFEVSYAENEDSFL
tara:strand:+ start:3353 stop:3985 length:633 start_codon:yes stop_codon:yes gene_type:complete